MISGINGNNSIYGYQSAVNQVKLAQALNRYTSSGTESSKNTANTVTELAKRQTASMSGTLNYIDSYSSSMTDLMSSANALRDVNSSSAGNKLEISSSDTSVVTAESRYKLSAQSPYEISVDQLATAQTNLSDALSSTAAGSNLSMEILGDKGVAKIDIKATTDSGAQKSNQQVLTEAAKAINDAGAGVKASVLTENGTSRLQIASEQTGEKNQFVVTGDFADHNGMSNVTQKAQDAIYSVKQDGVNQNYTSDTNNVSLDFGGINMTLKKAGTATISTGPDTKKVVSAMEDLVKSYNNSINLLSKNTDRGSGSARRLSSLGFVTGSTQEMDMLGLSKNKDGTLALDKNKLTENLQKQPELTKDLISGNHGFAQRAYNSAQSGLNTSVASLVGNDLAQSEADNFSSPVNYMNMYSRSGAYNMMNYYASGMFFSMMV